MKTALAGFLVSLLAGVPALAGPQETGDTNAEAYFQFARARSLELDGEWDQALEAFDEALALDPLDSSIYSEIAFAYFVRNDPASAIDYAQRALLIDEDNLDAHRLLSEIYTALLRSDTPVSTDLVSLAVQEWEQVVRLDPEDRSAYLTLGKLYTAIGDQERAAGVYRDFLRIEPASEEGALALAQLQVDAGNLDEAIRILGDLVAARPDSGPAQAMLGDLYYRTGDFDRAATALEAALTQAPDSSELLSSLAQTLFLAGRLDEAAERYEALVDLQEDDPIFHLRLGQIYRQRMEYDKARAQLERADRLVPDALEIRLELALLDRDEGHFEEALGILQDLLDANEKPRYTTLELQMRQQLLRQVAVIQTLMNQYREAVQTLEEIKTLLRDSDDGTIDSFIVDTLRQEDSQEAMDRVVEARRLHPQNRQLQLLEADLTAELVDVDQGADELRAMLEGTEDDLDVYAALVGVYENAGNLEAAQSVVDEMLDKLENDETAWFLQGALYERQDNVDEAEHAFRMALELDGENPATLNYLGYMLADRNRNLDEALTMLQTAVASDPINGAFLDSLGWVYFRLQQMDLAERFLTRAVLFSDSDPTLHEHLGDLYVATSRIEMAREEYRRSLDRADTEEERTRVQEKLDALPAGTI